MLTRRGTVALAVLSLAMPVVPLVGAAAAGEEDCPINPETGERDCEYVIVDPPTDPGEPPTPPVPGDPPTDPVDPPEDPGPDDPPPGAGPPFAPGYYPMCSPFQVEQDYECWWPWVDGGTPGGSDLPSTPKEREAAERAIAKLKLEVPGIGSAPCTEDGCMGAVGVPVWLWVNNPWREKTARAEIGSGQIVATARPRHVDWDLGDGTRLRCEQGTPYQESYGWAESPDCGHMYQETSEDQPGQRYTVTADLVWDVKVTGAVDVGFSIATRSSVHPAIGEYQSVVTDR